MEATGDMLENKPILKSDENDVGERSCDLINGLTSKYTLLQITGHLQSDYSYIYNITWARVNQN